jgi:flagellar hook-basal body complex protein FliE
MPEPISMSAAALMAAGNAAQGAGSFFGAKAQAAAQKKAAKLSAREQKRKTFADMINEALNRTHDISKDTRRSQNELSVARARALQDAAAGIRQALLK